MARRGSDTASRTVKANTLLRAAQIMGGLDPLCRYLSVPRNDLIAWMAGDAEPTLGAFLLAVDLVLQDSLEHGRNSNKS
jgi:hypothetical protein